MLISVGIAIRFGREAASRLLMPTYIRSRSGVTLSRLFAALANVHYTMLSQKYWSFTVIAMIFSDKTNMLKLFERHEMQAIEWNSLKS